MGSRARDRAARRRALVRVQHLLDEDVFAFAIDEDGPDRVVTAWTVRGSLRRTPVVRGIRTRHLSSPLVALSGRRGAVRPLRPGISIGPPRGDAGSLGAILPHRETGAPCGVTAAHVIGRATAGADLLQPSDPDLGWAPDDTIGRVGGLVPLETTPDVPLEAQRNLLDGAWGSLDAPADPLPYGLEGSLEGFVDQDDLPEGAPVVLSGASSGLRVGRVVRASAAYDLVFVQGQRARLLDQILTTAMASGGDSGGPVLTPLDPWPADADGLEQAGRPRRWALVGLAVGGNPTDLSCVTPLAELAEHFPVALPPRRVPAPPPA
jgi:hypothetical protein